MSQESRIVDILKDGEWHTTFEIVKRLEVGPIMNLKGRISDLRNHRGCRIEGHSDIQHCQIYNLDRFIVKTMWWYRALDLSHYRPPGQRPKMSGPKSGQGTLLLKEGESI